MAESLGPFQPSAFLAQAGSGRKIMQFEPGQAFFSQGDAADSIFYLQSGRAKLTVVSKAGKEATITLFAAGDFVGEEALATVGSHHLATATAITACKALRIERAEMVRVMHEEHAFSDVFLKFLISRSMRTQADLIESAFQLQRKAFGQGSLVTGGIWRVGRTERIDSSDHAANPGGDDRDYALTR